MVANIFFVLGVASWLGKVWALVCVWEWFVVPLGLPPVGFWHMAGLSVLISIFTYQFIPGASETDEDTQITRLAMHASTWLVGWGMAALCHWWML